MFVPIYTRARMCFDCVFEHVCVFFIVFFLSMPFFMFDCVFESVQCNTCSYSVRIIMIEQWEDISIVRTYERARIEYRRYTPAHRPFRESRA